ncbi:VOC family protein [Agrobacterium sp. a22-2]|nr:VOC family protein [Agrobacterium sp. a22-2]
MLTPFLSPAEEAPVTKLSRNLGGGSARFHHPTKGSIRENLRSVFASILMTEKSDGKQRACHKSLGASRLETGSHALSASFEPPENCATAPVTEKISSQLQKD